TASTNTRKSESTSFSSPTPTGISYDSKRRSAVDRLPDRSHGYRRAPGSSPMRFDRRISTIDLTAVANTQHEELELVIGDVVHCYVVADANAHLPVAILQLPAIVWTWIVGESIDGVKNSLRYRAVELAQRLQCGLRVGDLVSHELWLQGEL